MAWRCAYGDNSLASGCGAFSAAGGGDAELRPLLEKEPGSKSRGDEERNRSLEDICGRHCGIKVSPPFVEGLFVGDETGESEAARLFIGSSLREAGEPLSGLAIRRPPSDCERLRSPSMEGAVASSSGQLQEATVEDAPTYDEASVIVSGNRGMNRDSRTVDGSEVVLMQQAAH